MTILRLAILALALSACATEPTPDSGLRALAAHIVIVQGDSQTGAVHTQLPNALAVRVLDDSQRPIAGHPVAWRVTRGGGTTFAGYGITDDSGRAYERWTLGDTAGAQTIEARAVDSTGTPIVFARIHATAQPGALYVHGWPQRRLFVFLDSLAELPLMAHDRYGNRVANPPAIAPISDTARYGGVIGERGFRARDIGRVRFVASPRTDTLDVYVLRGPLLRYRAGGADSSTMFSGIDSSMASQCPPWCGAIRYANGTHFFQYAGSELGQINHGGTWRNLAATDSVGWHYGSGASALTIYRR
jgi:hypothetical protein